MSYQNTAFVQELELASPHIEEIPVSTKSYWKVPLLVSLVCGAAASTLLLTSSSSFNPLLRRSSTLQLAISGENTYSSLTDEDKRALFEDFKEKFEKVVSKSLDELVFFSDS
jgi:hypothetical protein